MDFTTIYDQLGNTIGNGINTGVSTYVNSLLPRSISGIPAAAGSGTATTTATGNLMGLSTTELVIGSVVVIVLILAAFKAAKK
jgi:hypothetical protein